MTSNQARSPRLYSYTLTDDTGFAPNPYHGVLTLACCKPKIRKSAEVGDYLIGTFSNDKKHKKRGYVVYAARVTQDLTFDQYWDCDRFACKKADLSGSVEERAGDNIYHRGGVTGQWIQENSAHSNPDGTTNDYDLTQDTKTNRLLVSDDFVYWGGDGPDLPSFNGQDVRNAQGFKYKFEAETFDCFVEWFDNQPRGRVGDPTAPFDPSPIRDSCNESTCGSTSRCGKPHRHPRACS